MIEIWQSVKDYDGIYEVSNMGRVKALRRKIWKNNQYGGYAYIQAEKMLKPRLRKKDGHYSVALQWEGIKKEKNIGDLVLTSFVGDRPSKFHVVYHKDKDPANNTLENLIWVDKKDLNYNLVGRKRIKNVELDMIFLSILEGAKYICSQDPDKKLQPTWHNIAQCLRGAGPTACGYHWEYI